MAVVPPQGNRNMIKRAVVNYRKHSLRYTVFLILVVEIFSLFLKNDTNYATFTYPLLTQIVLAVLFMDQLINYKVYKLCMRKVIAFSCLSFYYLLGVVYLIFGISDNLFYNIINGVVLFTLAMVLVFTFKKE